MSETALQSREQQRDFTNPEVSATRMEYSSVKITGKNEIHQKCPTFLDKKVGICPEHAEALLLSFLLSKSLKGKIKEELASGFFF